MSVAQELCGMPGPWRLERVQVGGAEDIVRFGSRVLFRFARYLQSSSRHGPGMPHSSWATLISAVLVTTQLYGM